MKKSDRIAEKLAADWWAPRTAYERLTGDLAPDNVEEAYDAQKALQERLAMRRGRIVGRKIALSSKTMQEMVGIDHPVAGAFFAEDVHTSPATIPAKAFRHLGLEFELAVELSCDVAPQREPHTAQSVGKLVAAARPAFELIEDKDANYDDIDALTLIADNAWCGGVVLGSIVETDDRTNLGNLVATVHQNGEPPETANTGAADPLGSMAWILNHFSERGVMLRQGEQIITGSAVRTRFPVPGDVFSYDVAGATVDLTIV